MNLESIIKNIDVRTIRTPYGTTFQEEMVLAANELIGCIQSRIKHNSMGNALKASDIADVRVDGMTLTVSVGVQNCIRPSIFNAYNGLSANIFWLLNDGFEVKKKWVFAGFKHPERWTHREAERYVEEGIKEFESKNRMGIKVVRVNRPLLYYG